MSRAEQLRLFAEHEQDAIRIARGFRKKTPPSIQTEDLDAAARMGLWEAIARGRDITQAEFSWYWRTRVRGSIIDELRRQDWLPRRERSREHAASVVYFENLDRNWETLITAQLSEEDDIDHQLDIRRKAAVLEAALVELAPRDRKVMRLVLSGVTQAEVGVMLGVSFPRVSQLVTRARARLAVSVAERLAGLR